MNPLEFSGNVIVDIGTGTCKIDGTNYPAIGLGTYRLKGKVCEEAVKRAALQGYRIFDTGTYYENFSSVAKGLEGQDRQQFYLISKVWHDRQSRENVFNDMNLTLDQLQTDYVDAYLIHWPNSKISIKETLSAMEELRQQKKVRHLGLSNVSANHLKKALEVGVPITWVQVEMHPYFYDRELLNLCQKHFITIQAWRPLNLGRTGQDEMLMQIGKQYGKTGAQVALRWILQHGCIPLPGSKSEKHIVENLDVFNFTLSEEEMRKVDERAVNGARFRLKEEHGLGFTDEFDFSYEECWSNTN